MHLKRDLNELGDDDDDNNKMLRSNECMMIAFLDKCTRIFIDFHEEILVEYALQQLNK